MIVCAAMLLAACGSDPAATDDRPDDVEENPGGPPAGMASCGSAPPLSQFPIPVGQADVIGPLGVMSGGGHLFPASHLGIHTMRDGTGTVAAPVSAPGSLVIRTVNRTLYTQPGAPPGEDYAVFFYPCADLRMHFGHLVSLDAAVLAAIGSWDDARCAEPYLIGDVSIVQCAKDVNVELTAGAPLGTMGGPSSGALDWGAADRRVDLGFVNPARMGDADYEYGGNNVVCPVDYLPPPVRASVHDLFGEGSVRRTAEPVCGTVMQDLAGTAQGRWFISDDLDERKHLGLVRDYIDPSIGAFSVGSSIPSLPANLYRFDPVDAGRVNVDFPLVTAEGLIYCYEPRIQLPTGDRVILIQLVSAQRLRIEGRPGTDCGAPATWSFSAGAVEFLR